MKPPAIPANEPERLLAVQEYDVLDTPPEASFDELTQLAAHILDVPIALVTIVDSDRQWFKSRHGLEVPQTSREISFCGHVVAAEAALVVPDALEDPRFVDNPLVTGQPRIRFYAGIPLRSPQGLVLGTLCAIDHRPRNPSPSQLEALGALARHALAQLELRRQSALLRRKDAELARRRELLDAIVRAQAEVIGDPRAAFDRLLRDLLSLTASEYGFIGEVLRGPEGAPYLKTHAITNIAWDASTRRFFEESAPAGMTFSNLKSLFGAAMTSGEPVIANHPASDPRRGGLPPGHPPLNAFLGLPLYFGDNLVGLVGLANRPEGYDEALIEFLRPVGSAIARFIEFWRSLLARDQAQQAQRDNETRLRALVDTAVDAILTIDEHGQLESVNPAVERLFGYSSAELLGQNVSLLMPAPHASQHDQHLRRYLTTGERRVIGIGRELMAKRKDGTTFPCELSVGEMTLQGKRFFTGILRDASARKLAEERRSEALSDLRKSQADLLSVLDHLRIGTLAVDPDGRVVFASRTSCLAVGQDIDPSQGRRWEEVLEVDEPTRQVIRAMVRQPEGDRRRVDLRLGREPGARWVELEIRDDPRNAAGRIFYLYDVSEVHRLRSELLRGRRERMVGDCPAMRELYANIRQVAEGDWTVLLEGETGTGKELVAQAIHQASPRRGGSFVAVNCAGLTESLLGSQLFGHVKGAFTGAVADREGLFEAAGGGTLFLDEIGDVAPSTQSALLRVLQEKEVTRVGETKPRKVDARIIVATHRDLKQQVAAGQFREDLLYRIRSARIRVPPLRERRQDVPLLVASFLAEERVTAGKLITDVSPAAMNALSRHSWPGNVRELRGAIEHAVVRCRSGRIELEDLPAELVEAPSLPLPSPAEDQDERSRILAALRHTGGNRVRAARILKIGRATLYRRLRELKIGQGEPD